MKNLLQSAFPLLLILLSAAFGQGKDSLSIPAAEKDTASASAVADSSALVTKPDSLSQAPTQQSAVKSADSLASARVTEDNAAPPSQKQAEQRLKLVKRTHTGRQQVVLAASMMVFVISIMTLAQQWNPR